MKITADQLSQQVALARSRGWLPLIARAEKRHKLPNGMLLAIASRETNMQDIVGDGGHGRGLFQIDDRFHGDWLAKHGAPGAGTTPRIKDAAEYAAAMLASNVAYAQQKKVGQDQQVRFAASAYNAGCGGAYSGFQAGNCDQKTTGGDYGSDVLEIHADAVRPGDRVLIVDDVLATGGTAAATARLVERLGAEVVGFGFIIELAFLKGREKLDGREIVSLITYE